MNVSRKTFPTCHHIILMIISCLLKFLSLSLSSCHCSCSLYVDYIHLKLLINVRSGYVLVRHLLRLQVLSHIQIFLWESVSSLHPRLINIAVSTIDISVSSLSTHDTASHLTIAGLWVISITTEGSPTISMGLINLLRDV